MPPFNSLVSGSKRARAHTHSPIYILRERYRDRQNDTEMEGCYGVYHALQKGKGRGEGRPGVVNLPEAMPQLCL